MKRIIVIFLSLALLLACVPTPDQEYVAQKDMTQMIEQAKQTPISGAVQSGVEQSGSAAELLQEKHVQLTFTGNTTDLFCVEVDAKVTRPTVPMPIVRVSPGDFDEETANRFFAVLTEGFDLYTQDHLDTAPVLDQKIQKAMDEIANGNDEQPVKDYLNELIEKRKTAPDTIGEPVKRVDLHDNSRLFSADEKVTFHIGCNKTLSDGRAENNAEVWFYNFNVLERHDWPYCWWWETVTECKGMDAVPEEYPALKTTPIEAETMVNALLNKLELTDLQVADLLILEDRNGSDDAYLAICLREIDGIPVAFPNDASGSYEGSTYPSWGYECAIVSLTDQGLAFFLYHAPLVVEDTVVAESNLLPFEDVMQQFKSMMRYSYEVQVTDPGYSTEAITYYITDITLSLQRVNEEDNVGYGLLVPVWNFWGYRSYVSVYDHQLDTQKHSKGWKGAWPILTINAVTGAVIDPIKGY